MRRTRTAASDSVSSDRSQPPPGRSARSTRIGYLAGLAGHGVEQVVVGHGFPSPGNAGIWERNAETQGHRLPTRRARRERGQRERPTGNEEAARGEGPGWLVRYVVGSASRIRGGIYFEAGGEGLSTNRQQIRGQAAGRSGRRGPKAGPSSPRPSPTDSAEEPSIMVELSRREAGSSRSARVCHGRRDRLFRFTRHPRRMVRLR
jgi:hypothetical protein